jgi:ribose-phosphate pyrophosphokinase
VEVRPSDADPAGRDVVVTDDIVATGSTMGESVGVLTDRGAKRVFAACVHPLLTGAATTRLARAGVVEVLGTDTIERPTSAVSAAPAVAERL